MFGFSVRTLASGMGSPKSGARSPNSNIGSPSRPDSPKPEVVGEIDTRAPFESVRAAVSLFGDSGSPRARPVTKKTKAEEQKLLERETQHHIVLRELDNYKDQLRTTEAARADAFRDLQIANRTVQELTNQLEALSESKQAVIRATEAAKNRTQELEEQLSRHNEAWQADVDTERELYKTSSHELISTKQDLTNLRQDFDAALEAKLNASQESKNAIETARGNRDTQARLSGEVAVLSKTLEQLKLASHHAEDEHMKLIAEKEIHLVVHKSAKDAAEEEIRRLQEECGDQESLEENLEETNEAIVVLQQQFKDIRASDLQSLQAMESELVLARKELQQAVSEHSSIKSSVDLLSQQLEEVKQKLPESKKAAVEAEVKVEQLQTDLQNTKTELDEAMSRNIIGDMQTQLIHLLGEVADNTNKAEEIKQEVELLQKETEVANAASKESNEKLEAALKEAEEAKVASKQADDQIYTSPSDDGGGNNDKDLGSVPAREITLTTEEFKSMNKKMEKDAKQADDKEAVLSAEMQSISEREKEVQRKVEELLKECEAIQSEIDDAVKQAEVAEAATMLVEGELRKWRETEERGASSVSEQK